MSFEDGNLKEGLERNERYELARDEIRNALILHSCTIIGDDKCIKEWANKYAVRYNEIFDIVAAGYDDILSAWELDPDSITDYFHEQLGDHKQRKAA